jgi:hypothetical protein
VQRRGLEAPQQRPVGVVERLVPQPGGAHRLLQPRGRLAGGGGQRDPRRPVRCDLAQRRQQPCDRGGLAGARAATEHGDAGQDADGGRQPLVVGAGSRPQPGEGGGQPGRVHLGGRAGALQQVVGDRDLLPPVAVEPENAVLEPQGPDRSDVAGRHQRASGDGGQPGSRIGPGRQRARLGGLLGVVGRHAPRHVGEPQRDRALPHAAHAQRGGEQHRLVRLAAERAEPPRDVHVRDVQDAGVVEGAKQAGGAGGRARVEGGHGRRPASRSDSATTRGPGGRHAHTPGTTPSADGVTASPHIPRRNRYSTPPRCRSGS